EEDLEEEEEYSSNEITRCICGKEDSSDASGLFIQCDKCLVWQHGFCVGIKNKSKIPDQYWCEKCRPELHTIKSDSFGNKFGIYHPNDFIQPNQIPKRNLIHSKKLKLSKNSNSTANPNPNSNSNANQSSIANSNSNNIPNHSQSNSRKRGRTTLNSSEEESYLRAIEASAKESGLTIDLSLPQTKRRSRRSRNIQKFNTNNSSIKDKRDKIKPNSPNSDLDIDESSKIISSHNKSTRSKSKSRYRKKSNGNNNSNNNGGIINDYDSDKPVVPRIPLQKISINEMRRRVAAILEFIGRTQYELSEEQKERKELIKYTERDTDEYNLSEDNKDPYDELFKNYEGSLKMMDEVTRKLLVWEQKFGRFS
ncbi:Cti6p ASCRUDRAFT_28420, partial [Ascoidea rubescens DSM 1968]